MPDTNLPQNNHPRANHSQNNHSSGFPRPSLYGLSPHGDRWEGDGLPQPVVTVGLDIDGVLCDTTPAFCLALSARIGVEIVESDLTDYDWQKCPKLAEHLVTAEVCWDALTDTYIREEFARLPVQGAAHVSREVAAIPGVQVKIITARNKAFAPLTLEWLHNHGFVWHELIHSPDKHLHGCDVFVEDCYSNAAKIADHHGECQVFLMDKPYNRYTPNGRGAMPVRAAISRIADIAEILPYIRRISRERGIKPL